MSESDIQKRQRFAKGIFGFSEHPHRIYVFERLRSKGLVPDGMLYTSFGRIIPGSSDPPADEGEEPIERGRVGIILDKIWSKMTKWEKQTWYSRQENWEDWLIAVPKPYGNNW